MAFIEMDFASGGGGNTSSLECPSLSSTKTTLVSGYTEFFSFSPSGFKEVSFIATSSPSYSGYYNIGGGTQIPFTFGKEVTIDISNVTDGNALVISENSNGNIYTTTMTLTNLKFSN